MHSFRFRFVLQSRIVLLQKEKFQVFFLSRMNFRDSVERSLYCLLSVKWKNERKVFDIKFFENF